MKITLVTLMILFPALVVAPVTRLHKASLTSEEMPKSINTLRLPGFQHAGQFDAANQGPYKVSSFRHQTCDGSIALLPLYRNAEGSNVLMRLFDNPALRYGVIFDGEVHSNFPQLLFTAYQLRQKALGGTPFNVNPIQPYAFAERGQCQLAELLSNAI